MELISRRTAMELARKILNPKLEFKKLEAGVSKIDLVQVLESELERKFISALKEYSELPAAEYRVKIEAKMLDAGNGYHLSVDDQVWVVEPQILLDETKGTSVSTLTDFLISHADKKELMPIALSLDGWEYHHARMETDTRQRLALHRTGRFRIWTRTRDDVDDALKPGPLPAGLLGISNSAGLQAFLAKRNMLNWQDLGERGEPGFAAQIFISARRRILGLCRLWNSYGQFGARTNRRACLGKIDLAMGAEFPPRVEFSLGRHGKQETGSICRMERLGWQGD